MSANTIASYTRDLTRFVAHMPAQSGARFDVAAIERWVAALHDEGLAARSIARALSAVRTFGAWLVREGHRQDLSLIHI